ncbi:MAG: sigma-70 family RNA polymerase sigma factor [Deltaproteobacteria bacterium]|nr:sigma-70 family RNA polymerase sigma factor [Deltaproteobacteria bacterium]MBK8241359.1 sigma-70 family RNA polymerase sigma factor [Deltaproteobacteria bacterium]MBK8717075.1 sigma-70 family RNA polymerase sigma factor [Deltaproteobacteria bacterium]MBP7286402.1 sigma-70 family RNA polymerase sigma factor [Nannocystaceae bacterium]
MNFVPRDEELLTAWSAGDKNAGKALYDRYFPTVYRFFSSKLADEVDDLVQRTFLACTKHRDRLKDGASFRGFVLVVARNELASFLRRRYRDGAPLDPTTVALADLGATPSQLIYDREEHRLLVLALRRIPLVMQEALELHFFERLTGPELAEVLEIPEGTVRSRIRRGLEALRTEVERLTESPELIESTVGSIAGWAAEIRALADRSLPSAG